MGSIEENDLTRNTHKPKLERLPDEDSTRNTTPNPIRNIAPDSPVTPEILVAQILQCQTWLEIIFALDAVSRTIAKPRVTVYKFALKCLSKCDRQHLVQLLATYLKQSPQDNSAYDWLPQSSHKLIDKAIALANSIKVRDANG